MKQMNAKIQEHLKINSYEMFLVNQTILTFQFFNIFEYVQKKFDIVRNIIFFSDKIACITV